MRFRAVAEDVGDEEADLGGAGTETDIAKDSVQIQADLN